jgi:hypothetical protein
MIGQSSSYAEIVVKVTPARMWAYGSARSGGDVDTRLKEAKRSYDALVYTNLQIPKLKPSDKPPPGQPDKIVGLKYVGKERITVRWSRYLEYLAAFVEGDKAVSHMRERLLEAMPEGIESVFTSPPETNLPVRLWWASDTPELEDLPWELVTYSGRNCPAEKFSFVRGLPPETPSLILPVGERLRLAFIHDPSFTPHGLQEALNGLPPDIEVIDLPEFPRKALEQVAHEGYELVHIVADGVVSSAYEGILYFHGGRSTSPEISPGELSAMLRGSRATVLGLTEQDYSSPDTIEMGGQLVPSVYRAFAYLGSSRLPLPSVVAPLGPLKTDETNLFWKNFYSGLAETYNLHNAITRAQSGRLPLPIALFLRHPHEVLFRRRPVTDAPLEADPTQIGAALQLSHELIEQLKAHNEEYGSLPAGVSEFIESESARQESLTTALDPWLTPEEGEISHEQ